jgi:hypothetical protein
VWEVDKGVPVASLTKLPAVFEPQLSDADFPAIADRYYTTTAFSDFPLVQTGPADWPRAGLDASPTSTEIKPAGVSNIGVGSNAITFEAENTGVPVIVRASAFPGWTVEGAQGPYRATPNYLVVVPTANQVTLTKGRTPVDWLAIGLALAGVGLLVLLGVRRRRIDTAVAGAHMGQGDDPTSTAATAEDTAATTEIADETRADDDPSDGEVEAAEHDASGEDAPHEPVIDHDGPGDEGMTADDRG